MYSWAAFSAGHTHAASFAQRHQVPDLQRLSVTPAAMVGVPRRVQRIPASPPECHGRRTGPQRRVRAIVRERRASHRSVIRILSYARTGDDPRPSQTSHGVPRRSRWRQQRYQRRNRVRPMPPISRDIIGLYLTFLCLCRAPWKGLKTSFPGTATPARQRPPATDPKLKVEHAWRAQCRAVPRSGRCDDGPLFLLQRP